MNVPARVPHGVVVSSFFRSLDLPVRESLEMGRRSWVVTACPAVGGLALIVLGTWVGTLLLGYGPLGAAAIRGELEAILIGVPSLLVAAVYFRVDVPPRAVLASAANGLLLGGVVALCMIPFLAFVAFTSPTTLWPASLLIPVASLGAVASIPTRTLRALDQSWESRALARSFGLVLFVLFAIRLGGLS